MTNLELDVTLHFSEGFDKIHLLCVIQLQHGMYRFAAYQPIV